jgi:steroid delta-isomerase-like uncharacterized protein
MSAEQNKSLVLKFVDQVLTRRDFTALDEIVSDDFIIHGLPASFSPDKEGLKQAVQLFHSAFSGWQDTPEIIVVEGDRVAIKFTGRGTHMGTFLGIPPTGKQVEMSGMAIYRVLDGKIVEDNVLLDTFGLMQQLSAISPGR